MFGVLIAGALVASACGSDKDSKSSAGSTAVTAAAGSVVSTDATGDTATSAVTADSTDATDSTSASTPPATVDPSLAPVVVGFHNLEDGTYSLPDVRKAFLAGVDYVNEELGGINGHKLEAKTCNVDVTPESVVNCGNQFVEDNVVLAVQGIDFAVDAMLPVLKSAGILNVAPNPLGASEDTAIGDVVVMGGSQAGGATISSLFQARNSGAKKIAFVFADQPTLHTIYDGLAPVTKKLGVETDAYFYPQPTDWTTFAPTVLAGNPDYIQLAAVDADCLAAIPAFRSAGFTGTIDAGSCSGLVQTLDADQLKNVIVGSDRYTPDMTDLPAKVQGDVDVFNKYMAKHPDITDPAQSRSGFYIAVQAAELLRGVTGDVTAKSVLEQGPKSTGTVFFSDTKYDCGNPSWPGTTSCTSTYLLSEITADRKLKLLPGQPVDLSEIFPQS